MGETRRQLRKLWRAIRRNRRLRMLITGRAELVGGPLDGSTRRVPRLTAIGLYLPEWGAVVRWADGTLSEHWPWTTKPDFEVTYPADAVWYGNYDMHFAEDCYRWEPTHQRTRSEAHRFFDGGVSDD